MWTALYIAEWLFDFWKYCFQALRPKLSWRLAILLIIAILVSILTARRKKSASAFTASPVVNIEAKETREIRAKMIETALRKKVLSIPYLKAFIEELAGNVGMKLAEEYQEYVRKRRNLYPGNMREYYLCICAWVHRMDTVIENQAKELADRDNVKLTDLEPFLHKYFRFSQSQFAIPMISIPPSLHPTRKMSLKSCEEIVEFAVKMKGKTVEIQDAETMSKQMRTKIEKVQLEDEVWMMFNMELKDAVAFVQRNSGARGAVGTQLLRDFL